MNATDCEHGARCNNPKENAKIVFEKRNGAIIFGASGIRPKAIPEVDAHANGLAKRLLAAYTGHESDLENPVKINAAIIDNGLAAVKHLCPNLDIVSLQTGGKETHERRFNIEDGDSVSWEMKWRSICSYFGLNGIGPPAQLTSQTLGINCLIAQKDKWPNWVVTNGLERGALGNVD
ncbi:hypothetical protein CPAR01_12224 [Colletotrichum paranaense]|uniref:PRISE-like Rossmann-fold domain-containing protein n=1 Tax=Colletotrichum paranaense TaxID=1914294 RepID=A0ABQ9S9P0_9PEZI|nr:uncharacterized protein CPAR01_12224 [Colletotrichum paranaense]KAK1529912.1 hypothetical protein CPAR01_12224 [Colletotrichum paranaense]